MEIKEIEQGKFEIEFENFMEVAEYCDNDGNSHSCTYTRSDFCRDSFDEAVKMLTSGWKDGVKEIDKLSTRITRTIPTKDDFAYEIEHDVVGDYIDMGRYMTGEPECFGRIDILPLPKETINILVNMAVAWHIKQDIIYNRGAAITTLIEKLRRRYHVTLQFMHYAERSYGANPNNVKSIKMIFNMDLDNEFSRDLIAFYSANSAFVRRIAFRIMEKITKQQECGGYGTCVPYKDIPKDTIYFREMIRETTDGIFNTTENAARYVERVLERYSAGKKDYEKAEPEPIEEIEEI